MEQDLSQYITNEFYKLQSDVDQRSFIENFRFLMMSNDFDFDNYYSNNILKKSDFYSIVDMLYQINNLWMLSGFIHQNRQFLFNEVRELTGKQGKIDFSTPCRLGQDTMLSRMSRIMKNYSLNESTVSENAADYNINTHKLKIYATTLHNSQPVPQIIIQGKWVEKWGFSIADNIRIECYQNKLVIIKEEFSE